MATLYLSHPDSRLHLTPPGHPERVERLEAIQRVLDDPRFAGLTRENAPLATLDAARLAHSNRHVDAIAAASPSQGIVQLDPDTWMSPGSLDAALLAIGAAERAVAAVLAGEASNAFCGLRPPGHHAEIDRPMGFCLFNQAAVAARRAIRDHGLQRVAIIDWDVHHGNGTQDIFWSDPSVLYVSTHEHPLYPGTGAASERGEHDNIVNLPLAAGTDGPTYRQVFAQSVVPRVEAFRPDLVIISAGFDAHRRDPLANLALAAEDFGWMTRALMDVADRCCGGRVVSILEGGYDLPALGGSVAAHVEMLMQA